MKVIHVHAGKANPATTMNGVNVVVDACARTMHRRGMDVEVWGIARNPHTNRPRPEYPISLYQYFDTWPPRLERDLIHAISRVDSPRTVFHFYSGFLPPFVSITRRLRASAYFCMPQGVYSEACLQTSLVAEISLLSLCGKTLSQEQLRIIVGTRERACWTGACKLGEH